MLMNRRQLNLVIFIAFIILLFIILNKKKTYENFFSTTFNEIENLDNKLNSLFGVDSNIDVKEIHVKKTESSNSVEKLIGFDVNEVRDVISEGIINKDGIEKVDPEYIINMLAIQLKRTTLELSEMKTNFRKLQEDVYKLTRPDV